MNNPDAPNGAPCEHPAFTERFNVLMAAEYAINSVTGEIRALQQECKEYLRKEAMQLFYDEAMRRHLAK